MSFYRVECARNIFMAGRRDDSNQEQRDWSRPGEAQAT
jgi:hypothetical protein